MKIKATSWHYRLNTSFCKNWDESVPPSLCPYVRVTLYRLMGLAAIALITAIVIWFLGTVAVGFLGNAAGVFEVNTLYLHWYSPDIWPLILLLGILTTVFIVGGVCLAIGIVIELSEAISKLIYNRKYNKYITHKPKEPGLVRSYIKARKQKLCPMIEIEH
ncbi:membrane protein [Acinetobacter phage 133]|uniref:Conserved hypothetical phage protein n=1 Tax=Acinetobacter phage 133 TaxID=2919552 RepID=D9I651_9CAUD|nr:membrane protein [Acinetobacter phage 133]ADJ19432.1 conserved hypothetical phage protein [Acinetobacter phage 133]